MMDSGLRVDVGDYTKSMPWPLTNVYVIPGWRTPAGTAYALTAGRISFLLIFVSERTAYDRIGINVTVAAAGGSLCRVGIYAKGTDGWPGALILDGGTLATDAIAGVENVIALTLARGYYYTAGVCDDTPTITSLHFDHSDGPVDGFGANLTGVAYCGGYAAGEEGQVAGGLTDPAVALTTPADQRACGFVKLRRA